MPKEINCLCGRHVLNTGEVRVTKDQIAHISNELSKHKDAEWTKKLIAAAREHHKTMNAEIKLGQYAAIDVTNYHKGARDALLKAAGKKTNYFEQEGKK